MTSLVEAAAALTGPGSPFEIVVDDVLGEKMEVFAGRRHSLREVLEGSTSYGELEYLVFDDGRRYTYAQNERIVASVAASFRERFGVGPGDRVAILAANCPEWIFAFWATVSLGAVAVGMNAWWTADEAAAALTVAKPKVLVVDATRLARLVGGDTAASAAAPAMLEDIAVVGIEDDFAALVAHDPAPRLPDVAIAEDDPATILYTSGTSGRPKGVVHSHRNILAMSAVQVLHGMRMLMLAPVSPATDGGPDLPAQRTQLVSNPLFHVSGLYTHVVTFMSTAGRTVWTTGRFDPAKVLRLIEEERVTGWSPMGSMAARVVGHPDARTRDTSTVVTCGSGGAPVSKEVQDGLREVFPNAAMALGVGYGQTECTALATLIGGREFIEHPDSVGPPLPTVQVAIRDDAGGAVPDGVDGEIWVRSPLVMLGYWGDDDATAEVLGSGRWLRTGDIGRLVDGMLYVNARARDLILRAAENVLPPEIEARLESHPAVLEAAVYGVDHPELGQEVAAVVVVAPDDLVTEEELAQWCAATLAYYKVPSRWSVTTDALPRNASGKVMKHVLGGAASGFVDED